MRHFAAFTLFLLMVSTLSSVVRQQPLTPKASTKTIKFAAGETTIESTADMDHVTVKNAQGTITSESWCDFGAFDAYFTLFTKFKESAGRGDRAAVVKQVGFPLRVNGEKHLIFPDEDSLLNAYDKVFTSQVLDKIRRAEPAAVFCRDGQGMLGDGVVWALVSNGTAKATVINP